MAGDRPVNYSMFSLSENHQERIKFEVIHKKMYLSLIAQRCVRLIREFLFSYQNNLMTKALINQFALVVEESQCPRNFQVESPESVRCPTISLINQ
jgi:hypothetical protein